MGAQMQRRAYSRVCGASTAKRPAAMGYAGAGPATALSLTCPGLRDYKTAYPAIPRRHAMKPTHSIIFALATVFLTGCASSSFMYKDIPVSKGSAEAGTGKTVAYRGSPLKLDGTPIKVGDTLRDAKLATRDRQVVAELASMPDIERAVEEARKVAGLRSPASAMPAASGSMGGGYGGY